MVRILVIDTTGFMQRQVQRGPSGFAVWFLPACRWFRVRQSIFVLVLTARVPTGGGQEAMRYGVAYHRTNTNAKGW